MNLLRAVGCLFRGHSYPSPSIDGYHLYFCANGCGREYLKGYLSAEELHAAFEALPYAPIDWPDDPFDQDEHP